MSDPIPQEGSHSEIILSTPLTVIGIFVALLRERFDTNNPGEPALLQTWTSDEKTTELFIESGFEEHGEFNTVNPGIWVDRDQLVYGEPTIGRQDQWPGHLPSGLSVYYASAEMDILLDCTSKNRGESMMIGSVVHDFIQTGFHEISRYFGFRWLSPVLMNRTRPFEKDQNLYTTLVTFRVGYEARWVTLPATTVLSGIASKIADKDDPALYFRKFTLRDK